MFEQLGLDPRSAIELFLTQVASRKAIPFPIALPDSEYAEAEYSLSPTEIAAAGKRLKRASAAAQKSGGLRAVTGIDSLRE